MIPLLKRRTTRWLSIASTFFILPAIAIASATMSWTPPGANVKSPVTISVSTTGDFRDIVDGVGCDVESFTNWTIHVVGAIGELFGDVMGSGDQNAEDTFTLPLGLYSVDIACSEAPVQQNNGQGNNPALIGNFEVRPWSYSRTPSGSLVSAAQMTVNVAFDNFAATGCAADAESWRVTMYNSSGEDVLASTPFVPQSTLSSSFELTGMQGGYYGTVEIECLWNGELYGGSVFLENGNGDTIFTVPFNVHRDDEILAALNSDAARPLPTMTFGFPKENDRASKIMTIVHDANFEHFDTSIPYDVRGLVVTSVSLYYAHEKDGLASTTLIAKDLPAKGEYVWEVINLPEGDDYQIVAVVTDIINRVTTLASPRFGIDHTPPAFRLSVNPPVTQGEEVVISVDAEEDLDESKPPEVRVEQQFAGPITLTTKGAGKHFETIYYPVRGHDGEVKMTVFGQDRAKNTSDKIVSGGLFYVGIEPPEKPVVTYPLENDVFSGATTSVVGVSRIDTEVALQVNGTLVGRKKVDAQGGFRFENVPVSKEFQRGVNALSVVAYDQAGHQSEATLVRVKYNLPPRVAIISPKAGVTLARATTIRALVNDDNNDDIAFTYEVSDDRGATWVALAKNIRSPEFKWRTMDVLDGEYMLRVTADDGFEKAVETSAVFEVRNYLPRVEFDGGNRHVTNKTSLAISGSARAENPAGLIRSPIRALAYRVNNEKEWHEIVKKETDEEFARTFSFTIDGLTEGSYRVQVRATDERGFHGMSVKTVIVDYGPPPPPHVATPPYGAVLAQTADEDPARAGVQFTVRGKAEPHAILDITGEGGAVFSGTVATSGEYTISGVTIREHGAHTFMVTATDLAGNVSPAYTLLVTHNNPPTLRFRSPRVGRGLSGEGAVRWEATDPDGDKILPVSLSWRLASGGQFKAIPGKVSGGSATFDVRELPESTRYELRLEASDGISASSLVQKFTVDNTPPQISITPLPQIGVRKEFVLVMEGEATDNLSGVEYIEYSIDGVEWYKGTITKGYLGTKAQFRVRHPFTLPDGTYTLQFRAVDASGGISSPATQRLVVDTTPPRIGSYMLGVGMSTLTPVLSSVSGDSLPEFHTLTGESQKFTISLEADTASGTLHVISLGDESSATGTPEDVPLTRDVRTGLWWSNVTFAKHGKHALSISAGDKLGNTITHVPVGKVRTRPRGIVREVSGEPISDARVTVLVFNEDEQRFVEWNGRPFGLEHEKTTDSTGAYAFLLPPGTYQLHLQKTGYGRVRSGDFTVAVTQFVSSDFVLKRREGFRGMMEDALEFFSPI